MKFLVIHLELIGPYDGFAGSVLDDADDSLDSTNSLMMFGESGFELYSCKLDVELRYNLDFSLSQILSRFDYV